MLLHCEQYCRANLKRNFLQSSQPLLWHNTYSTLASRLKMSLSTESHLIRRWNGNRRKSRSFKRGSLTYKKRMCCDLCRSRKSSFSLPLFVLSLVRTPAPFGFVITSSSLENCANAARGANWVNYSGAKSSALEKKENRKKVNPGSDSIKSTTKIFLKYRRTFIYFSEPTAYGSLLVSACWCLILSIYKRVD